MADHDLAAELQGYRNELANVEAHGKDERADSVREEIKRVEGEVRQVAEDLERKADEHDEAGQGVLAAEARAEASRYREHLGEEDKPAAAKRGAGRPRKENAADKTPKEQA